jgi:hypothetical protein
MPSAVASSSSPSPAARNGSTDFPLRAFFGHHKCATGWTGETLRELTLHMGRTYCVLNRPKDFASAPSLGAYVERHGVEVLTYANANVEHVRTLPLYRGFHVVRDPRDVLVSAYFSHKKTHSTAAWPELEAHRDRLRSLSKRDGLLAELEFSAPFFEDMAGWDYEQENVLELKMEAVTASPVASFLAIADFLDLLDRRSRPTVVEAAHRLAARSNRWNHRGRRFMPGRLPMFPVPKTRLAGIPPALVEEIVGARTFEKLTGRRRGQENRNTHLRKGQPGDWKNHFEPVHVRAFKERYNDLVVRLGYEDTPDW